MKKPVDTGLSYSRLCEWTLESDTHLQEVIDVVYRRHIPEQSCPDRTYAGLWLKEIFFLPESTREKMGLFNRAKLWDPRDRGFTTQLIASGLRDRLIADLKREETQGYRTKRFLDGILSRYNHCKAHTGKIEIAATLRNVSGYESAVHIAAGIRDQTMILTLFDPDEYPTNLELSTTDFPENLKRAILDTREKLGLNELDQLRLKTY